jgi:hypothetical protein
MSSNLISTLVLLVFVQIPVCSQNQDHPEPIDSFRGLAWGSTTDVVRDKIGNKEFDINTGDQGQKYYLINNERMFDCIGTLTFITIGDRLVGGAWYDDLASQTDLLTTLNLLEKKYGKPISYLVNGLERAYRAAYSVQSDFFRSGVKAGRDKTSLTWQDQAGNRIEMYLLDRRSSDYCAISVKYHSLDMLRTLPIQEDY